MRGVRPELLPAWQRLRKTAKAAAPGAEEVISYGMPALRQNGILVYYAAFSRHCSFFVGSVALRQKFAKELRPFAAGKGTERFTPDHQIPPGLITRIVKARVAENQARASAKARASKRRAKRPP